MRSHHFPFTRPPHPTQHPYNHGFHLQRAQPGPKQGSGAAGAPRRAYFFASPRFSWPLPRSETTISLIAEPLDEFIF